jgi:hypothetical protein
MSAGQLVTIGNVTVRTTALTHPAGVDVVLKMGGTCSRLRARIFHLEIVEDAQTRRILKRLNHARSIAWLEKHVDCTPDDLAILLREGLITVKNGKVQKKKCP